MKHRYALALLPLLWTPAYLSAEQPLDIELLEFIGLWEPDESHASALASAKSVSSSPNQAMTNTSWRDPFAIPVSAPSPNTQATPNHNIQATTESL
ncbi:MAG: hypothetical protein JKX83_00970 [Pseudomonadales bacterium]|nr:hypothetical protein [Pseudomonadales bacterium]